MEKLKEFLKNSNKVLSLMVSLVVVFVGIGVITVLIKVIMFMGFWFVLVPVSTYFVYKYIKSKNLF